MKPTYDNGVVQLLHGDVRQVLRGMAPATRRLEGVTLPLPLFSVGGSDMSHARHTSSSNKLR